MNLVRKKLQKISNILSFIDAFSPKQFHFLLTVKIKINHVPKTHL